jgi:glycosyltransferase involved in cell wall biosynthesis
MSSPAVSVLMSVYNSEAYLEEAIESVLAQTFGDFEFLIIDDGSTDASLSLLAPYARKDKRVQIVSRPNTGLIRALNELVEMSRGKYVARMDPDDISLPTRFEKQVRYLDGHPECAIVGSRVMLMDPYSSPVCETGQKLTHEEIEQELLHKSGWAMVHPSVMMRRDAVLKVGMYREQWKHCEDHDLFLRLAEVGKLANLPEVLLWYRRHYGSINFNKSAEQAAMKKALLQEAWGRRGLTLPEDWKPEAWAPPPPREQIREWGWAALKHGNVKVARRHAWAMLRHAPGSKESWRLLYCALRGR